MKKIVLTIIIIIILITSISIFFLLNKQHIGNETAAIKLYENLIDTIMEKNSNRQSDYLSISLDNAIDPLNKKELSSEAKEEILNYAKKYHHIIYNKNKEDLLALEFEKINGLLINFSFSFSDFNKVAVNVFYYAGNQASGEQTYLIEYMKERWNMTKTNKNLVS
ncbi:MAG: hypothetical protein PHP54_01875 [Clostridia bacterium]|nr:hypothetical protein [Clostridia bacterium]